MNEGIRKTNKPDRVLARRGARELTREEVDAVSGAFAHTNVCTGAFATQTHTGIGDGDGCGGDVDGSAY
jgi:hypothetical protein